MEELDFSEEACIKRYVMFPYFDDDCENSVRIEGLSHDDRLVYSICNFGFIEADMEIYEEARSDHEYKQISDIYNKKQNCSIKIA
ncbi:MAG: hypothetical protein ABIB41_12330 [Nitrospirota bacterium]